MKKLNIIGKLCIATVCKCLENDKIKGKPWCIYKEGVNKKKQPKGWPKHFITKEKANKYLDQMEMFKNFADKNK